MEIIRTPDDFDRKLKWDSLKRQQKKFEENKKLRKALEESTSKFVDSKQMEEEMFRLLILSAPNENLEQVFKDLDLGKEGLTFKKFIASIEKKREKDPDFLETITPGKYISQLLTSSSGASYDIAKLTANLTGSYLVTDIYSRWKEIEVDRENQNAESREWSPFAKAFQSLKLKFLNNLDLEHALILRKEKQLEHIRVFLRKVWKSACTVEPISEINANLLADELKDEIKKAEVEWKKIDRKLLDWVGNELKVGLIAAGPMIASGYCSFLAAALALGGITKLGVTQLERKSFQDKFPAAFFMKLK